MKKQTKDTLAIAYKFEIMKFLEVHCLKPENEKYAYYDKAKIGELLIDSDQAVMEYFRATIPNINIGHVRFLRQQMGLTLERNMFAPAPTLSDTDTEILKLYERIDKVAKELNTAQCVSIDELKNRLSTFIETTNARFADFARRMKILEDKLPKVLPRMK